MRATSTIYGIANCDTMKKARKWLDDHDIEYRFHDYRKHGLDAGQLEQWIDKLGWEALLNRRGTTWRRLDDQTRRDMSRDSAIAIMLENPAIIRRPLLVREDKLVTGFSESGYQSFFLDA